MLRRRKNAHMATFRDSRMVDTDRDAAAQPKACRYWQWVLSVMDILKDYGSLGNGTSPLCYAKAYTAVSGRHGTGPIRIPPEETRRPCVLLAGANLRLKFTRPQRPHTPTYPPRSIAYDPYGEEYGGDIKESKRHSATLREYS